MAKYLLDTTVLIDHLLGRKEAMKLLSHLASQGHEMGTSCVNIAELYSGLSDKEYTKADKLISGLSYYEISSDAARMAGNLRFRFARKGIILTTTDTLIASAAINHKATLITANVKDYPMEEIEFIQQP